MRLFVGKRFSHYLKRYFRLFETKEKDCAPNCFIDSISTHAIDSSFTQTRLQRQVKRFPIYTTFAKQTIMKTPKLKHGTFI